jgi:hypothetical protein
MKTKIEYSCGECLEKHDDEDDARECCAPEIITVFSCGQCGECYHHDELAADDCCADVDEDTPPYINQRELEAAGQLRFAL